MNTKNYLLLFVFSLLMASCSKKEIAVIDLSGDWQFQMDPNDIGEKEKWFNINLAESVKLPGSMVENDKGYDITLETQWTGSVRDTAWFRDPNYEPYLESDGIRFPFWLQPEKKYTGAAWYRKNMIIPENWKGKNIQLMLERPHWESKVWINGIELGVQNSLATPHKYELSEFITPGENHISIRIDNRIKEVDVGRESHSISDHTQSNWNGIVGEISLQGLSPVYFEDVRVFPDIKNKSVQVKATVNNKLDSETNVDIGLETMHRRTGKKSSEKHFEFKLEPGENLVHLNYPLGAGALMWDEFNPNVYELQLELRHKNGVDLKRVDFGLREFKVENQQIQINGRRVYLRGTLECAIFPKTGYPPCNVGEWEKVFTAVKDHGLNHVRFHSWCPPKAAFVAADKMGIYLQVECSSWANQSTQLGSGFPVDQYIYDESERIVAEYGNHPSFVMMAYGNEPGGPGYKTYLTDFVKYWKEKDNRRIYTSAAGWPALEVNEYHNLPQPRIQGWGEELNSIINSEPPQTDFDWSKKVPVDGIPMVSHEIGQWCVYPNFKEIEKYTGPLKARNFELFRESLNANHLGDLAEDFLMASGKLQALCYKADIEAALRTPGFGGFQLLDLHDFPGQGTALVGVLDAFWEEKGYISPEEFRRFCNTTVPLARLKKRIFTEGETLLAAIEVAHFGNQPIEANPAWKLTKDGNVVAEGTLGNLEIQIGNAIKLGEIEYLFPKENTARKLVLEVAVDTFVNSWDLWVYPEIHLSTPNHIRIAEQLTPSVIKYLESGGTVLLSLGKGKVAPEMGGEVGVGFSSIFWNTAWTGGQKPHTLGILCNPEHPALAAFPTEYHSNWQWWDAMSHCDAIRLNNFPVELKPIVRIIDDWVSNRSLAMLFEAKVGNGKILVSGVDLVNGLEERPEARQLLTSLTDYISGEKFNPEISLSVEEVKGIIR
jgi:hypothetical protein